MPTFTAIALDRLLEPGTYESVEKSVPTSNEKPPKSKSSVVNYDLDRRNSVGVTERKVNPALYATPESTPLPDAPSSFPPSPYIINHKRRGPRLLKSYLEDDVASQKENSNVEMVNEVVDSTVSKLNGVGDSKREIQNGTEVLNVEEHVAGYGSDVGSSCGEVENKVVRNGLGVEKDAVKLVTLNLERDIEIEDFFDPNESLSYASYTDGEDVGSSVRLATTTPWGEFYDACEELSCENGLQSSYHDVEADLRELRLNLLMEIEKQKQTEEILANAQNQWQRMREQLALVGLALPAFSFSVPEDEGSLDSNPAEELCQQVYLSRVVSETIAREMAKAEAEMEKEEQIEAKNFEIARLWDRLHYYEAVNREMSQRNQEAVESGRRYRQIRKRRQRWFWGSVAALVTLGTASLAWSCLPASNGSPSTSDSSPDNNSGSN